MICLRLQKMQKSNKRFYTSWGTFRVFLCFFFFRLRAWNRRFDDFFYLESILHEVTTILAFAQPQPCAWCFRVWILGPQSGVLGTDLTYKMFFFSDLENHGEKIYYK